MRKIAAIVVLAVSAVHAQPPTPDTSVATNDGLRLSVFAASFLRVDNAASVLIGVELDGVSSPRRLEIRCVAQGEPSTVESVRIVRAARDGIRVFTRMSLPAGLHTVSVMVRDLDDSRSVAVAHPLAVPNLVESSLTMSNLLVSASGVGGETVGDNAEEHIMPLVGRPPTGRREFSRRETLEVDAEIYEAETATEDDAFVDQLSVSTSVVDEDGRVAYSLVESGTSETLPSGVNGYPHYTLVPIARLTPGRYTVQVSATVDGVKTATRSVAITVKE